jgi:hypothetical protein
MLQEKLSRRLHQNPPPTAIKQPTNEETQMLTIRKKTPPTIVRTVFLRNSKEDETKQHTTLAAKMNTSNPGGGW